MAVNEQEQVEKIAKLARIKIQADDIPEYEKNMQGIIKFVEYINSATTKGVDIMAHPFENMTQRLREDEVTEQNKVEELQSIAPKNEDNFYLVNNFMKDSEE